MLWKLSWMPAQGDQATPEWRNSTGTPRTRGEFVRYRSLIALFGVVSFSSAAYAQDWPQWRGPNRDGIALAYRLPNEWPTGQVKPLWQVPLGDGYSGPVVVGDRLFVLDREGENENLICLNALSGKEIWKQGYPAPYKMHDAATAHGLGPKATATVADGRVYTFGISSILSCFDAATGTPVWSHDLKSEYEAVPAEYGSSGSPLVDGPRVIVPVGGVNGGAVMAFNKTDGSLAWKAVTGEMPAYCSPIAADLGGVRQILTFTEKQFLGIDAANGKELWKYPFSTSYRQNTVTPVVFGDLVIASGLQKFAFALRVTGSRGNVQMTEAWKNRDLRMYMSSPVLVGEYLFGLGGQNALVCVNVTTGKTMWTGGEFGDYVSIVVAGDRLLILDTMGQITVVRADGKSYQPLGRTKLCDGPTWSHLALVVSRIYVRNRQQLACFDMFKKASN